MDALQQDRRYKIKTYVATTISKKLHTPQVVACACTSLVIILRSDSV